MIAINIASRLKRLRKEHDLTQKELADKLHISSQVISNIERGYTVTVDPETLAKLADVFNVDTDYLLGRKYAGVITRDSLSGNKDILDLFTKENLKKLTLLDEHNITEEELIEYIKFAGKLKKERSAD